MKTTLYLAIAAAACGDNSSTTPRADAPRTIDGSMTDAAANPPPPTLGAQLDRFGRPAVNTALNNTFNGDSTAAAAAKNAYNADSNAATWSSTYSAEVAANLAIYDGLDTMCGNQLAAGPAGAGRYSALAEVLADDRQWINTAGVSCNQYLAVELNALGVTNADCGGRTLPYDVIDVTYSALAIGAVMGVGDSIAAVPQKTTGTTFPYLAAPLPL